VLPPTLHFGKVVLSLYRGPSDYNFPRFNERTLEVALGLWFMRRSLQTLHEEGLSLERLIEVGNVLQSYWPREERLQGTYVPWQILDLGDNGLDATRVESFQGLRLLSLSTVEHFGYDNEGVVHAAGFRVRKRGLFDDWVRAWDAGPSFISRVVREATEFLITFPIGFNPRMDAAVSRKPWLKRYARVVRRVDALNRWEVDVNGSFEYHYDHRDVYTADQAGIMFDPEIPLAYARVYGEQMPPLLRPPKHPRFRFANAVCVVTNVPELLAS